LKEEVTSGRSSTGIQKVLQGAADKPTPITEIAIDPEPRLTTQLGELDRVLGGGVVPGSVILVGGDPGIGKTTLLFQMLQGLGQGGQSLLYVSGEESPRQLKMRGDRLGISSSSLYILAETSLETILKTTHAMQPAALVVDSIQTVYTDQIASAPGSVSQVQEVACQLMWYAKRSSVPVFIIGHVTKDGMIAGPKLLEHIVDTVLYFEGDKGHTYRILRAVKNRFGPTNEIGVFEMKDSGLEEVANPSELFLAGRPEQSPGSVVVSTLEGTRPILVELQALVTSTGYAMPKRMANGVEVNRVSLLLAVMEKRLGLHLSGQDVYFNVVGGLRIDEPAIDLGIVAAVVSSFREQVIDAHTLFLGEVGLGGEIRPVTQVDIRAREAMKLGFKRCVLPEGNLAKWPGVPGLEVIGVREIGDVLDQVMARA
jgi:DNA repair protein RadA/Sms